MEAFIVAARRSPVGRAGRGALSQMRADELAAQVMARLLADVPAVPPAEIDDVLVGCAVPEGEQGMQIGRLIALQVLPREVPGMVLNRYCGSGVEAIHLAAMRVVAGTADCVLAGGAESMSGLPMMGYRPAPPPALVAAQGDYFLSMGLTAEELADEDHISREEADAFAQRSHERACLAQKEAYFEQQLVPIAYRKTQVTAAGKLEEVNDVLQHDEGPRADSSLAALAQLRPVFKRNGQVTAGNSSQRSDGAAFVLVCSAAFVRRHDLQPMGRLVSYAVAGVNPRIMGIGPVAAIPKALQAAGIKLEDLAHIEINEAFATQVLAVCKRLELDPLRINPEGGAIALGHPLGCTGAKLTVQTLGALRRKGARYGLISACVGGGQGVAAVVEAL